MRSEQQGFARSGAESWVRGQLRELGDVRGEGRVVGEGLGSTRCVGRGVGRVSGGEELESTLESRGGSHGEGAEVGGR